MKIVLQAFNGKLKGVMEVPEETGHQFKLAMTQPIQAFNSGFGDNARPMMDKPINKICTFEWNGKIYSREGHEYDEGRIYELVDIF